MLQHEMVNRIERVSRLRLIYGAHLTLYGVMLACYALVAAFDPAHWQLAALVLMVWLPMMLGHTALQTIYEAKERCATETQFAPAKALNRATLLPVDLYDEDGNLLRSGEPFTLLPPPRV
ncbi:MAG: hypothetical protein ABI835_13545 [Chloroflexota bacterium]